MRADLDATLAALADPARRRVVHLLSERPRRSSELARALAVSRPAMSRHLRVLRQAGLVEQEVLESDTRVRMVQLRREPFTALRAWVEDVETFWSGQLDAFREHVERKQPLPRARQRQQHVREGERQEQRPPRTQLQAIEKKSSRREQQHPLQHEKQNRQQRKKKKKKKKKKKNGTRSNDPLREGDRP